MVSVRHAGFRRVPALILALLMGIVPAWDARGEQPLIHDFFIEVEATPRPSGPGTVRVRNGARTWTQTIRPAPGTLRRESPDGTVKVFELPADKVPLVAHFKLRDSEFLDALRLDLEVECPGFSVFRKHYASDAWLLRPSGEMILTDRVSLRPDSALYRDPRLDALGEFLPVAVRDYSGMWLYDRDEDQRVDEVLLTRRTGDCRSPIEPEQRSWRQSFYSEIRHMVWNGTIWRCEFLANHRGVRANGGLVPGTPDAPYGYAFMARGLVEGVWLFHDLHAVGPEGQWHWRWEQDPFVRSYLWHPEHGRVEVVVLDPAAPEDLIKYLAHSARAVKREALDLLEASGSRDIRAVPALLMVLQDPLTRYETRESAEAVLRRIRGIEDDRAISVEQWEQWWQTQQEPEQQEPDADNAAFRGFGD